MFGCCVAGRPLQTNLQEVDDTHALFELPAAGTINHICVFLLGTVLFPEGYGATVHFFWPGKGFQLLGMLSNDKPSAIFRLRGTFTPNSTVSAPTAFTSAAFSAPGVAANDVTATLGFAIEPLSSIEPQISTLHSALAVQPQAGNAKDPAALAERIARHLFNYVSGFAPGGMSGAVTPESVVPMGVIARWYDSFLGKVRAGGVGFLERGD